MSAKFTTSADSVLDGLESMSPAEQAAAIDALGAQPRDDLGTLRGLRNMVQLPDGTNEYSVIMLGDSFGSLGLGTFFGFEKYSPIRGAYRCGGVTALANTSTTVHSSSNGNANYDFCPDGYYYEVADGGLLYGGHLETGVQGVADTIHVTLFPGTGTATIAYSTDGAAFTSASLSGHIIDTSLITTVQVVSIALPAVAQTRVRLTASGGTVNGWVGQSLSLVPGIKLIQFATSGQSIGQSCTVTEARWKALVTGYSADLVVTAFADGRYNDAATGTWAVGADNWAEDGPIDLLYQWSKVSNASIDWMVVGPHKIDPDYDAPANATLDALYDAAGIGQKEDARIKYGVQFSRQWALDNGEGYFDSYTLFPSFAEAFAHGMYLDQNPDIHLSTKGADFRVSALFERTNLKRVFDATSQRVGDIRYSAVGAFGSLPAMAAVTTYTPTGDTTAGPILTSFLATAYDASGRNGSYMQATAGSTFTIGNYSGSGLVGAFQGFGANWRLITSNAGSLGTSDRLWLKTWTTGLNIGTATPASASAAGTAGDIAWDASYIYVCTATNTWKRVAIATW